MRPENFERGLDNGSVLQEVIEMAVEWPLSPISRFRCNRNIKRPRFFAGVGAFGLLEETERGVPHRRSD
jgi:hypothetical protein